MTTREDDLIARARELQRLVTKRRRLKRNLRAVETEIKHVRKMLAALKAESEQRRPDVAPSRLHAGITAAGILHPELATMPAIDDRGGAADGPQDALGDDDLPI